MKKIIFIVISCLTIMASSCSTGKDIIQFTALQNYFYKNDAPEGDQLLKLTTQEEFNHHFGESAFMGKNGEPTKIDFSKDFVVAKVLSESNKSPEIINISLKKNGTGELILGYEVKEKSPQSFTTRPTVQLAVSREYLNAEIKETKK